MRDLKLIHPNWERVDGSPVCDVKEGQQREADYKSLWNDGFWPFLLNGDCIRHEEQLTDWVIISERLLLNATTRARHNAETEAERDKYKDYFDKLWGLAIRGHKARLTGNLTHIALLKPANVDDMRSCPYPRKL